MHPLFIKGQGMRKITLLSLVAATLVFTACGEDTKTSEVAVKAKAERAVELDKMAADKITAKAAEKAEVAQIRAAQKAAVKAKAEKEAAEAVKREAEAKAIAAEVAKKEAEAKVAAEKAAVKALKKTNATTDASIIEAANKEIKAAP